MSEIKRTNETESYNTTADWLQDFINKMAKSAPPAPPTITTASREKFATIEDKMKDIKARVGFGSITKITKESQPELSLNLPRNALVERRMESALVPKKKRLIKKKLIH